MTKSGKHCGKMRNCTFCAISSFVTMFSKSHLLQRRQKAFIWGKGLKEVCSIFAVCRDKGLSLNAFVCFIEILRLSTLCQLYQGNCKFTNSWFLGKQTRTRLGNASCPRAPPWPSCRDRGLNLGIPDANHSTTDDTIISFSVSTALNRSKKIH